MEQKNANSRPLPDNLAYVFHCALRRSRVVKDDEETCIRQRVASLLSDPEIAGPKGTVELRSILCPAPIELNGSRVLAGIQHITFGLSLPFHRKARLFAQEKCYTPT